MTQALTEFPDSLPKGHKGSEGVTPHGREVSLQCQKEEAAPRHKITKILVQDSADLAPSFTGCRSSVRLAPT